MTRINYILRSMNVLNSLLTAAIGVIAYVLLTPAPDLGMNAVVQPVKGTSAEITEKASEPERPPAIDYALISDQNIFHPERKIPPEKKEEKAVPKPDVILYGTLVTDQMTLAFIEDRKAPKTTPGRGKRQTVLHKGDHLGGYTLTDVAANHIVLTKGEEKIVVRLEEGEKRRAAETPITAAAAGMQPSGVKPAVTTSVPPSPGQKVAQPSPSYLPPAVSSGPPAGGDGPGIRLPSRRNAAQLEVMRRKEAARQMQAQ